MRAPQINELCEEVMSQSKTPKVEALEKSLPDECGLMEMVTCYEAMLELARELESALLQAREDAQRWRALLMRVGGGRQPNGIQRFYIEPPEPIAGANILRGSVAEHFTNAIDAARQAEPQEGEKG